MRVLRVKLVKQLVIVRDLFISNMVGRLISLTSTGLFITAGSMGSQRTGSGDNDGGDGDSGPSSATMRAAARFEELNEVARRLPTGLPEETHSRSVTPSSRSATPLSPIPESAVNNNSDNENSSDADNASPQQQSGVKPAEDGVVSQKEESTSSDVNVDKNTGNGDDSKAMGSVEKASTLDGELSLGERKTVMALGCKPLPSSKIGNKIRTRFDYSGNCAMTNNLLSNVPYNAMLCDDGATCCCAKTNMGRLLGSFIANPDSGGISIGDESSTLESEGSYLHAIELVDANNKVVQMLLRMEDTPKAICSIFSEPEEVYMRGGKFLFTNLGRVWTLADGREMHLHMTANHLGWVKFRPISDSAQVRSLLSQTKNTLIVGVHRAIAASKSGPIEEIDNLHQACEQVMVENTVEIDSITASLNMLPFMAVDPTFQSIDYKTPLVQPELLAVLGVINSTMSPMVVTYSSDTSRDPDENHWLGQQTRDTLRERRFTEQFLQLESDAVLVASTKGKDLFVQVNRSIKFPPKGKMDWVVKEFAENLEEKLESIKPEDGNTMLAKMVANGLMSM